MSWDKVNLFAFLPPALSLYLLLISGLTKGFFVRQLTHLVARWDPALQEKKDVIQNVALGWSSLLGFFNATFAALVSVLSIWSATRSYEGLAIALVILLLILIPMMWWLFSHELDQIEATTTWQGMSPSKVCNWVLTGINVVLIIAIFSSQQLAQTPLAIP